MITKTPQSLKLMTQKIFRSLIIVLLLSINYTTIAQTADVIKFKVDLIYQGKELDDFIDSAVVYTEGESYRSGLDFGSINTQNNGNQTRIYGIVYFLKESTVSANEYFLSFDFNANDDIDSNEPRISEYTDNIPEAGINSGMVVVYFKGSCPCGGEPDICQVAVSYYVSIIESSTQNTLWEGEFHEAILNNSCSFTTILGREVPIADNVVARNVGDLALKFEASELTQIIPFYLPLSIKGDVGEKGERGDQGPAGQSGPQGPQGDKGSRGDPGPQGALGPKGPQGQQGQRGIQGPMGERGLEGKKGDQGDVGPMGPRGEKGDQGDVGPMGPMGEKGDQGDVGPMGPMGEKGDQGDVGPMGPQGEKGAQGDLGPRGEKGDQGDVGPMGPMGQQGPQGKKGESGSNNIADIVGSLLPCSNTYSANTFCQDGDLIRISGRYYHMAPTFNGKPMRVRYYYFTSGSTISAWNTLVTLPDPSMGIISSYGTIRGLDGTDKPANSSNDFKIRVRNGTIQEFHTSSLLSNSQIFFKVVYID